MPKAEEFLARCDAFLAKADAATSPAYERARKKHTEAYNAFDKVRMDYRARKVSDEVFLAAKKLYDAATKEFDTAFAKEARGDSSKVDASKPTEGGKYNAEAVQAAINKDKRIKSGEAKKIHSLLKGWRGDGKADSELFLSRCDAFLAPKADASFVKWDVEINYGGGTKTVSVSASNADDAKRFALERLGDGAAGKARATSVKKAK